MSRTIIAVLFVGAFLVTLSWGGESKSDDGAAGFAEYQRLFRESGGKIDERHLATLRKAAERGHPQARAVLGMYLVTELGHTDPKALKEGVSWLKKLENVEKPEFDGCNFMLALCYLNGAGTELDTERAGALLARTGPRGTSDMKMAYAMYLIHWKNDPAKAKGLLSDVASDTANSSAQEAKDLLRTLR